MLLLVVSWPDPSSAALVSTRAGGRPFTSAAEEGSGYETASTCTLYINIVVFFNIS